MGWQDRNYNSGGSGSNFLGNPAAFLSFSLPFGTWFGSPVRLHFWLLLEFLFIYVDGVRGMGLFTATITCLLFLAALLCHEFGHRFFARRVGGSHYEFILWPAGGMIPPTAPPFPWPYFLANVGGIAVNFLLALACGLAIFAISRNPADIPWNPLVMLRGLPPVHAQGAAGDIAIAYLSLFAFCNLGLIAVNLLPYYWFDGGPLLESILWPFFKRYTAINVTCIVGMVLAVPMFLLALFDKDILGLIMWALLFASAYSKRQQLKATGPQEMEEAIAWSANYSDSGPVRRKRLSKYALASARKKRDAEQQEQAKIDAILEKVHTSGLHSLTFWEKRTLKKATERQRKRDVANRR